MIKMDPDYEEPQQKLSIKTYDKIKAIEHTVYDIRYKEILIKNSYRRDYLKAGLNNSYAILYANLCTN